jgi:hypothetical protein
VANYGLAPRQVENENMPSCSILIDGGPPMDDYEYLVSYGTSGEFSRFRPTVRRDYSRGDRVVVRSPQGTEIGEVLCRAKSDHARFLSRTAQGELLRLATADDERAAERCRDRAGRIADDARRLSGELGLPIEVLDVEVALDGGQAIINHLRQEECDYRPLVSALSRLHDVLVIMQNLALPAGLGNEDVGCGKPGCGQGQGGCSSCQSGGCGTAGGCASGCGAGIQKDDVALFLAGLRRQMENRARTPLL